MPFPSITGSGYDDDQPYEKTWGPPEAPPKEISSFKLAQSDSPGLAPRLPVDKDTPAPQAPNLSQFGEAKPKSLAKDTPPGEQIDKNQMAGAEGAFHQTDPYHGILKSFGDRRAMLDHLMPTNVFDPNHNQDLVSYSAERNHINEQEAQFKQKHPLGSVDPETGIENHPGFWGKLGHVMGVVGDVAAPGIAERIPGSQLNLKEQEREAEAGLNKNIAQGADIQKANADTTNAQAKLEDVQTNKAMLADAAQQRANTGQDAENRKESDIKAQIGDLMMAGKGIDDPNVQRLNSELKAMQSAAKPVGQQHVSGMLNGKPYDATFDPATGKYIDPATGQDISGKFQPQPQQPSAGTLLVDPTGTIKQAKPGMHFDPGTQNIAGAAGLGRPTTQQRNVSAQADVALDGIPGVIDEVKQLGPALGPIAGRWNEFTQGKLGLDNPQFAGLQSDLVMLSSAVSLAHARGRLPENLRQEFEHMMASPQQSPENIVAVLEHVSKWMQRMGQMGGSNLFAPPSASPPASEAPGGGTGRPSVADWLKSQQNGPK